MSRILFLRWTAANETDLEETLKSAGHSVNSLYFSSVKRGEKPEWSAEDAERTKKELRQHSCDAVFSVNCYPVPARLCRDFGIPYIGWSYDSPIGYSDTEYFTYDTTRLFLFDRRECELLKAQIPGAHLTHLPLAVNTERLSRIRYTDQDRERYHASVSFLGQLYENTLEDALKLLPPYDAGYIRALIDSQLKIYGSEIIYNALPAGFIQELSQGEFRKYLFSLYHAKGAKDVGEELPPALLWKMIMEAVTRRERLLVLSLLGRRYDTVLYSGQEHPALHMLRQPGRAEYLNEMPKVFRFSEINLNITFRSIVSGIPLRCLDIMGSGGFLLSNYQPELAEYFQDGVDCAIYTGIDEAVEKCNYYLKHESERKRIAEEGYRKVQQEFRYEDRLRKIFEITGLRWK